MRSRVSNSRRFIFFAIFLSLYIVIKLLIITSDDGDPMFNSLSKSLREAGINPSAPTFSEALGTTVSLRDFYSDGSNCSTEHLGTPKYVRDVGCSGSNAKFCRILTCQNLLLGTDEKVYDVAKEFMGKYQRSFQKDTEIGKDAEDCASFKRSRGYHMETASTEDALFPVAFNILVHTNVGQMERLLRAIYRPQHSYCIHVDQKSPPDLVDAVAKVTKCFENVFVATKLEKIIYAGFTRLRADLNCMEDHVQRTSSIKWKYLLNVAAQSFPLQTPEDMVRILKIYNGSNDIEGIHGPRILRYRFEPEWEERTETMTVNQTGKTNKPPPHDLDIVRGSAFGVFSRKFVEWILSDKRSLDLLDWSRKTYSPDEHFWATLHHTYTNPHLRPPGGYSGPPNDKTWLAVFVKWGSQSKCHGRFVRGVCILGVADLPDLLSRKEFFVNKFYDDYQPLGLDCLEAWIKQKEECPVPFDREFYQNLPFVKRH